MLWYHPDFIGLVDAGNKISLFGLPVASASYAYSVIPVIIDGMGNDIYWKIYG